MESILAKSNPNRFRAMENKEQYLVIEKASNAQRKRIHLGEPLFFSREDKAYFEGELTRLSDSTLTLTYYDETTSRAEVRLFYLSEIKRVYKRQKKRGIRWGLHAASFVPLIFDFIYFGETPFSRPQTLYGVLGIAAANTVIANADKLFRSKKIGEKYRIRVFQYY